MSKVKANKRAWKGGEMERGTEGGGGGGQRTRDRNREKRKKEKYREEHSQGVKLKMDQTKICLLDCSPGPGKSCELL